MDFSLERKADDDESLFMAQSAGSCSPLNSRQRSGLSTFHLVKQAITNSRIDSLKSFRWHKLFPAYLIARTHKCIKCIINKSHSKAGYKGNNIKVIVGLFFSPCWWISVFCRNSEYAIVSRHTHERLSPSLERKLLGKQLYYLETG